MSKGNLTVVPITDPTQTPEETIALIEWMHSRMMKREQYRDALLFALGVHGGLRGKDILNLKVGDVRYLKKGNTLRYKSTKRGKNGSIIITDVIFQTIRKYLEQIGPMRDEDFLFPGRQGPSNPLSGRMFNLLVKKWVREEGLSDRHIGTHSLRKTSGLLYRWGGNDAALVGKLLGQSNPEVTDIYLGIQEWEVLEMQKRSSVFRDR